MDKKNLGILIMLFGAAVFFFMAFNDSLSSFVLDVMGDAAGPTGENAIVVALAIPVSIVLVGAYFAGIYEMK